MMQQAPRRVYQNFRFDELMEAAQHNPHRTRVLMPMEVNAPMDHEDPVLDSIGLDGYVAAPLDPMGVIGVILCIDHLAEYSMMHANTRTQEMSALSTQLQQDTEQLKTTSMSRHRKKVYELIGQSYQQGPMKDVDYRLLYQGLGELRHMHFILLHEAVQADIQDVYLNEDGVSINESSSSITTKSDAPEQKKQAGDLYFSSDPSTWAVDQPVWVADMKGSWLAIPTALTSVPLTDLMIPWLESMQQKGWTIHWPVAEGTKSEILEQLQAYPSWAETDRKRLKDDLACQLGKEKALSAFRRKRNEPLR